MHGKMLRHFHRQVGVRLPGVGQYAGQGGDGGGLAAGEVNARALGSAAAEEVAVIGAHADAVGLGTLTHADAEAAGGLADARACFDHIVQRAVLAEHTQHLTAAGGDDQRHIRIHGFALEDGRHAHHILIAGIGTGADTDLIHLDGARLPDGFHIVGHMGQSDHGFQLGQVDVHFFIIFRVRVGKQGLIVFLALLRLQEAAGRFVAGEHGGRCAQFRAHIGNGGFPRPRRCIPSPCPRRP